MSAINVMERLKSWIIRRVSRQLRPDCRHLKDFSATRTPESNDANMPTPCMRLKWRLLFLNGLVIEMVDYLSARMPSTQNLAKSNH
jgi:hypothetical protein